MAETSYQYLLDLPPQEKVPCWRWLIAMMFLGDPSLRLSSLTDPFAYQAAEFARKRAVTSDRPAALRKQFPGLAPAFDYYSRGRSLRLRPYIEALLLTDATDAQISNMIGLANAPDVLEAYRQVFFDVASYKDNALWVRSNLLATDSAYFDWGQCEDYLMKLFAWTWGFEAFNEYYILREPSINRTYAQWFSKQAQKALHEKAFGYARMRQEQIGRTAVELLKMTKSDWDFTDENQGDKLASTLKAAVFDQVSRYMSLQLLASTEGPLALEARDSSTFVQLRQILGRKESLQLPGGSRSEAGVPHEQS